MSRQRKQGQIHWGRWSLPTRTRLDGDAAFQTFRLLSSDSNYTSCACDINTITRFLRSHQNTCFIYGCSSMCVFLRLPVCVFIDDYAANDHVVVLHDSCTYLLHQSKASEPSCFSSDQEKKVSKLMMKATCFYSYEAGRNVHRVLILNAPKLIRRWRMNQLQLKCGTGSTNTTAGDTCSSYMCCHTLGEDLLKSSLLNLWTTSASAKTFRMHPLVSMQRSTWSCSSTKCCKKQFCFFFFHSNQKKKVMPKKFMQNVHGKIGRHDDVVMVEFQRKP